MSSRTVVSNSFISTIILSLLTTYATAQNAYWIYPPAGDPARDWSKNYAWQVGSTQTLSWYSAMQTASIELQQENYIAGGSKNLGKLATGIIGNTFEWEVNNTFYSLSDSPIFYLILTVADGRESFTANAHYLNITTSKVVSSVIPLPGAATITATSSAEAARVTSQAASTTGQTISQATSSTVPTTDSDGKRKGPLSTGAAVSIAVVVTILVLGVAVGTGAWYWRKKKRTKATSAAYVGYGGYGEKEAQVYAHEMSVPPVELGAGQVVPELHTPPLRH